MTIRLVVQCDGTPDERPGMALDRCRAFLPLTPDYAIPTQLIDPDAALRRAYEEGWSQTPAGRSLCPACTLAAVLAGLR